MSEGAAILPPIVVVSGWEEGCQYTSSEISSTSPSMLYLKSGEGI